MHSGPSSRCMAFFISHTEALPNLFFVFKEYSCQFVVIKVKELASICCLWTIKVKCLSILLFINNKFTIFAATISTNYANHHSSILRRQNRELVR